jgi:hypothetical protein
MGKKRPTFTAPKWQYIGLGALAVVTASAVAFTLSGPYDNGAPASDAIASYNAQSTPTATAAPVTSAGMLGTIQTTLKGSDPLVISVLGDSTGNGPEEWVAKWSRHLTAYGTVTLHQWNAEANDWNPTPTVFPGGPRPIEVWNGSHPGKTYTYPLERLDMIQPAKPSFVVLNFGHNIAAKPADVGSAELMAAVDAKWGGSVPAAVTLQNPALGSREQPTAGSVAALSQWTAQTGYPAINVNAAFKKAPDLQSLLLDELHPNDAGTALWTETVIATLG